MYPTIDVITLGHLSHNPYWKEEKHAVRPPLATTTLIRSGDVKILVDPSLPPELMAKCLFDRSGLEPSEIDMVFLTSFHPTHRRSLYVFDDAKWLINESERDAVASHLNGLLDSDDAQTARATEGELAILGRTTAAEDVLADGVDLFPSPGVTAGCCGLLIAGLRTTIIAGDAVLTRDHFQYNQVSPDVMDAEKASQSLTEIFEIADIIIPGHDNMFVVGGF